MSEVSGGGGADGRPAEHRAALHLPGPQERWRCSGCGNLTRFDVVRTIRTREYWHAGLSGEVAVDEVETLDERLESVTCRWCGRTDTIEYAPRAGPDRD